MTSADGGLLVLRLVTGLVFAVHGAQKTFGWWGGQGLRGWQGTMERMGYRPAFAFAVLSALVELVGGLLVAVGLLTPLAALLVVGQSVVIVAGVHWKRGFFNRDNGYEFPLVLGAGFLALLLAGPGAISVDAVLGLVPDDGVRMALVILGLAGGAAMLAVPRLVQRPAHAP
ncbi:MAG TPA: DoxX family protein [Candidatus Limnocylindrales bacterium]